MEVKLRLAIMMDEFDSPAMYLIGDGIKEKYDENTPIGYYFKKAKEIDSGYQPIMPVDRTPEEARNPRDIRVRDTVKCIKVNPREGGLPITLGDEYTVLESGHGFYVLFGKEGRTYAESDEIEFLHGNKPVTQLDRSPEEVKTCELCQEPYVGHCGCVRSKV